MAQTMVARWRSAFGGVDSRVAADIQSACKLEPREMGEEKRSSARLLISACTFRTSLSLLPLTPIFLFTLQGQ